MTTVLIYTCILVFIKFLLLDYCLLVACLDLELSLFEARSWDVKVANEIIRADALADQQNGGVAIYFPSHLLWFFRQKNVIHLNSKVANEMIRADQYNGTGPSQVHLRQKRVFHEAISAQCIKLGQRWLFESKDLKVLKIFILWDNLNALNETSEFIEIVGKRFPDVASHSRHQVLGLSCKVGGS